MYIGQTFFQISPVRVPMHTRVLITTEMKVKVTVSSEMRRAGFRASKRLLVAQA